MEHFTRITFWIVTLSCLQARYVPVKESGISFMQSRVECLSGSKFYTPKNVKGQCITTALDCVRRELNGTVREDCTDDNGDIDQVVDFIDATIKELKLKGRAMTNSTECACEQWSLKPLTEFLGGVKSFFHFTNHHLKKLRL